MTTMIIDKVVSEIKDLPDEKMDVLLNYVHFLKWEDDNHLSEDDIKNIEDAQDEIASGKGTSWRKIKRYV